MSHSIIDKELDGFNKLEVHFSAALDMVSGLAKDLIVTSKNFTKDPEFIDDAKQLGKEFVSLEKDWKNYLEAASNVKQKLINEDEDVNTDDLLEEELKNVSAKNDKSATPFSQKFNDLCIFIDDSLAVDSLTQKETVLDDGMTVISSAHIPKDPISQLQVTDPVKNRHCNHTYERASILQYIKKHARKCPYVACANKNIICPQDLIENVDVQRLIQQQQRK